MKPEPAGTVVLLEWMLAKRSVVETYEQTVRRLGWAPYAVSSRPLELWLPARARRSAERLAARLEAALEEGTVSAPVVILAFSGAPKCLLAPLLDHLREGSFPALRNAVAAFAFDSGPVDFVSDKGVLFLTREFSGVRRAAQLAAGALDALLLEEFERQRAEYWLALDAGCASLSAPGASVLLLHSSDDELGSAEPIERFARSLRARGATVTQRCWERSAHCAHLRFHTEEYTRLLREWLEACATAHRRRGGTPVPRL